jgi:hypothetical protein
VLGLAYRVYRLRRGGPAADVVGQAILTSVLVVLALLEAGGVGWARWVALAYALLFGLIVMPLWIMAVLIPSRPGRTDLAYTAAYWLGLAVVAVAAVVR